jgi:integrase
VGDLAGWWLGMAAGAGSAGPSTLDGYAKVCERFILPYWGDRPITAVTGPEVRAWIRALTTPGPPPAGRDRPGCRHPISTGTANNVWVTLRTMYNAAAREGLLATAVAAQIPTPPRPVPRARPPAWTAGQALRFLDSARRAADPLYPGYTLMLLAGLRPAEALGLAWDDLDLDTGTARVRYGLHINGTSGTIRRPIRTHQRQPHRAEPFRLPDPCLAVLRRHAAAAADQAADLARSGQQPCGLVLTRQTGQPVRPAYFNTRFRARVSLAAVPAIPTRFLGPTTPVLLIALGVPPAVVTGIVNRRRLGPRRDLDAQITAHITRQATRQATGQATRQATGQGTGQGTGQRPVRVRR